MFASLQEASDDGCLLDQGGDRGIAPEYLARPGEGELAGVLLVEHGARRFEVVAERHQAAVDMAAVQWAARAAPTGALLCRLVRAIFDR
ncbi:hypothetical protein [Rhodopila sp.]|uniref:hypothetical protein n=1 Tax=Rhodopila sp. TaxID=2480087 RepID=UPI003D0DCC26